MLNFNDRSLWMRYALCKSGASVFSGHDNIKLKYFQKTSSYPLTALSTLDQNLEAIFRGGWGGGGGVLNCFGSVPNFFSDQYFPTSFILPDPYLFSTFISPTNIFFEFSIFLLFPAKYFILIYFEVGKTRHNFHIITKLSLYTWQNLKKIPKNTHHKKQ